MTQKPVLLSKEGLKKLEDELEHLRTVRRLEVAERIQKAKELGSTQNNAEFDDAKNEQAFVEGRILTLENMIKNATIISPRRASSQVQVGSTVTVVNPEGERQQFTIVGSAEASPGEGKISNESPIGKALLGKRIGEDVEVTVPAGRVKFTVVEIG